MRARLSRFAPLAICAVLLLAGCGGSNHEVSQAPPVHLQRLRAALPYGFHAPGNVSPPRNPVDLKVAPAAGMRVSQLRPATAPSGNRLRRVLAEIVTQPAPVIARPILLDSAAVLPGQRVSVAAAHLGPAPNHAALFLLQGPNLRAEHLVAVAHEVAAGFVTLPNQMEPGDWYIAAQDISDLRRTSSGALKGKVLVDIGALQVKAQP